MNKRGAYFFVLDALIGGAILLVTLITIMNSHLNNPLTGQTYTLAEDTLNFMSNTKVIDYRNNYVSNLIENGTIDEPQNTIFQEIGKLHYTNKSSLAHDFTAVVLDSILEEQYGVSYSIGNTTIYNRSAERINSSRFMLTSKTVIFLAENATTVYGPDITELRVWK